MIDREKDPRLTVRGEDPYKGQFRISGLPPLVKGLLLTVLVILAAAILAPYAQIYYDWFTRK